MERLSMGMGEKEGNPWMLSQTCRVREWDVRGCSCFKLRSHVQKDSGATAQGEKECVCLGLSVSGQESTNSLYLVLSAQAWQSSYSKKRPNLVELKSFNCFFFQHTGNEGF